MTHTSQVVSGFDKLDIAPKLLTILKEQRFITPTPIQQQGIPVALAGHDLVGIAETGTGKTLAFGVPMIQSLGRNHGQALILLPTRELALQVNEVLKKIGERLGLKTVVLIGGASSHQQLQAIRRGPHVIVSTPGRLLDHLQQKNLTLNNIKMVVLDEADRMLDIGFLPAIKRILEATPQERQTLMFSATMPKAVAEIASRYMKQPRRIEVSPAGTVAKNVCQELFFIQQSEKLRLLDKLLTDTKGAVLVFSRTKHGAKKITANVRAMGHAAAEIHSNRSLAQRKMALEGFKTGRFRVLVATDIASRGIDVKNISLVVNYDLPDNCEDYVHRIGRTGRAEQSGKAISFATREERRDIRQIERLIKKTITVAPLPDLPPRRAVGHVSEDQSFGRNRSSKKFNGHRHDRSGQRRHQRRVSK